MRKANTPKQIVMFPFGGGSGYSYMELIKDIDTDAEIIVINPPGHLFDGTEPLESINAMAYLYSKELRSSLKDNPLFFGHSIGGIVAYEVCKVLEKEVDIKKMIISSVNAPHRAKESVDLHSEMDRETLIQKSTELGGMPQLFNNEPELLDMFIVGLRADLKALENYTPEKLRDVKKRNINTSVLYGDRDYILNVSKIREWEHYLDCSEFIPFPGDHFYLFEESNRKAVARVISKHVNQMASSLPSFQ
ncbi:MAG: thioesterase [Candidatus Aminicenantes bacterium]|nr:MAG: thioesterase [Candidatus Aminicenantes bacterium]